MKHTIAEKKANEINKKKFCRHLPGVLWCVPFGVVAYFCKYVVPGYSFTFLVCLGIIALILFYTFMPVLGHLFPKFAKVSMAVVTVCLFAGLIAAGITEYFIVNASFGTPKKTAEYMVVLGAKVRPDGPSPSLWDRINGAYDYLESHPDVIAVVSGGQGDDEVMSEAQSMFDELVAKGIAPERIWMEDKATNTRENLMFSLAIIEERTGVRPEKLAVCSSEYHLLRSSMVAKNCGVDFVGVPARTSVITQLINHLMREVPAVWKYAILGGSGND